MNDKPDIFGKYSKKMNKIHEEIKGGLFSDFDIVRDKVKIRIRQSTFIEYLEVKHDHGYKFGMLDFLTGNNKNPVMICLNEYFYKSDESDYISIAEILNESWGKYTGSEIKYVKEVDQTADLALNDNDMIQTIHYLYHDKRLLDEKKDYQIFKIIYPFISIKNILPMLI